MTNGEMMLKVFPDMEIEKSGVYVFAWIEHEPTHFDLKWWDAEYNELPCDYEVLTKEAYADLCMRATIKDDFETAKTEIQKCIDVFAHSDNETGGYVQKGLEIALSILNKFVEVEDGKRE